MKQRLLGKTEVAVSEIGFGVWTVSTGWWGEKSDEEAVSLLKKAFELGVTFFDTADTYGSGRGETLLAKAFGGNQNVTIATKFGYNFYDGKRESQREFPQDFSETFVRFALEQSLRRLGRDTIDLYQIHNPRMDAIDNDGLFELLEQFRQEGKIRAYGVALGPAIGWKEEGMQAMEKRKVHSLQTVYNLLEQDPGRDFFPVAKITDAAILVRVPHSSGLLEGKYTEKTAFPETDHRSHRPREWLTEGLKKLGKLEFLKEKMTLSQAALKYILAEPTVASCLPNIYHEEQLAEFAAASDCPDLSHEEIERVNDLYAHAFYQMKTQVTE
ncbi:MAG: aldo/keto reductase [Candidatus Omnitrophica bacterium]|nr:aldo/keto reductase [Candidatus Omnitrophota bacterium]